MSISVSVVVHDVEGPPQLATSIAALIRQTYRNVEVVLVTSGSAVVDVERIESAFAVTQITTNERHASAARNAGLSAASGEVVAFLDQAVPTVAWLERLADTYTHPSVTAVGGFVRSEDGTHFESTYAVTRRDDLSARQVVEPDDHYQIRGANPYLTLSGLNCSFRRAQLDQVGGFPAPVAIEIGTRQVCGRIIDNGGRVVVVPDAIVQRVAPPGLRITRDGTTPVLTYSETERPRPVELAATVGSLSRTDVSANRRDVRAGRSTTFSRRRPAPVVLRAVITDEGLFTTADAPGEAGTETHVLHATAGPGSVQPRLDRTHDLVWVHSVAAADRWVPGLSTSYGRTMHLTEAALLMELRELARDSAEISVTDRRHAAGWPLARLTGCEPVELQQEVARIMESQIGLQRAAARHAAEVLLDRRELGRPARSQLALAATQQGDEFVRGIFAELLGRRPTPTELEVYGELVGGRDGRQRLLTNLATSGPRCEADIVWMTDLAALEQDGLRARLVAAHELPPRLRVQELYRVLLGREPSLLERLAGVVTLRQGGTEQLARRTAARGKRRQTPHMDDGAVASLATANREPT